MGVLSIWLHTLEDNYVRINRSQNWLRFFLASFATGDNIKLLMFIVKYVTSSIKHTYNILLNRYVGIVQIEL
jgi:hypothetical protein